MPTPAEIAAVRQAYFDHADYAESGDVTKARAFQTACRRMIGFTPTRTAKGGRDSEEIELDVALIRQELQEVTQWIARHDAPSLHVPTVCSFENFRG